MTIVLLLYVWPLAILDIFILAAILSWKMVFVLSPPPPFKNRTEERVAALYLYVHKAFHFIAHR